MDNPGASTPSPATATGYWFGGLNALSRRAGGRPIADSGGSHRKKCALFFLSTSRLVRNLRWKKKFGFFDFTGA
jgi:hypothetical protein